MLKRVVAYFAQLGVVVSSLLLARSFNEMIWLVPAAFRKRNPLGVDDTLTIISYFLIAHSLLLAISWIANRQSPFSSLHRLGVEVYYALIATSLASCSMFLFTEVPFSANYYAWVYIGVGTGYLLLFAMVQLLLTDKADRLGGPPLRRLILSPWTLLTAILVLSPVVLAGLYKLNRDFSNLVNETRASFNIQTDGEWTLAAAHPPHRFEQPMYLGFEPERPQHILVLARPGRLIRYVTSPEWNEEVLLDISDEVNSIDVEMGAQGFALHPEFNRAGSPNAGFVYVYYTHVGESGHHNRLARFDLTQPTLEARNASRLLLLDQRRAKTEMHHGGTVLFGPEGFLYLSLGDFHMNYNSQLLDKMLLGGILRIDVDQRGGDVSAPIRRQPEDGVTQNYFIPSDNPWVGVDGALEEFWALGFRNPFRMSLDPLTGDIWLGDVGADLYEEHNRVQKGDNGQWAYMEGPTITGRIDKPEPPLGREILPVYYYAQTALARATVGGLVYRGAKYEGLRGLYVFADNQAGTVYSLDPAAPVASVKIIARADQFGQLGITSIVSDAKGDIYLTLLGSKERPSGEIVRLITEREASSLDRENTVETPLAEKAETTYVAICARCHGVDGRGEPGLELGVPRPDFTSPAWQSQVSDEQVRRIVVDGGAAVGLSPLMPGWGTFFSDEELDLLVRKVRRFGQQSPQQDEGG